MDAFKRFVENLIKGGNTLPALEITDMADRFKLNQLT